MTADPAWSRRAFQQTSKAIGDRGDRSRWWCSACRRVSASILVAAFLVPGAAPAQRSLVNGMLGWPVGYGTRTVDERRDPWVAVTDETVTPLLTPAQGRVHRVRRISIDYDADGVPDAAWMVGNGTQMGVLVRLGRSRRLVLAYLADGSWSDQRLYRIDGRTIGIEFPESTIVALSSASGQPMVYYPREGGD